MMPQSYLDPLPVDVEKHNKTIMLIWVVDYLILIVASLLLVFGGK